MMYKHNPIRMMYGMTNKAQTMRNSNFDSSRKLDFINLSGKIFRTQPGPAKNNQYLNQHLNYLNTSVSSRNMDVISSTQINTPLSIQNHNQTPQPQSIHTVKNIHQNSGNKYDPYIQGLRRDLFNINSQSKKSQVVKGNQTTQKQYQPPNKNFQKKMAYNSPKTLPKSRKSHQNINLCNSKKQNLNKSTNDSQGSPIHSSKFGQIRDRILGRSKSNAMIKTTYETQQRKLDKTEFKKMFEKLKMEDFANLDINESTAFEVSVPTRKNAPVSGGMIPSSLDPKTKNSLNSSQGFDNLIKHTQNIEQEKKIQNYFENKFETPIKQNIHQVHQHILQFPYKVVIPSSPDIKAHNNKYFNKTVYNSSDKPLMNNNPKTRYYFQQQYMKTEPYMQQQT